MSGELPAIAPLKLNGAVAVTAVLDPSTAPSLIMGGETTGWPIALTTNPKNNGNPRRVNTAVTDGHGL
jgi:hypothetical protein